LRDEKLGRIDTGQTPVHGPRDPAGLNLRPIGRRSAIHLVNGVVPQRKPAPEVTFGQRCSAVDIPVRLQGTTAIETRAEKHRLPKVAHRRNVSLQTGGPQLGKRLGQYLVV
jgi:hypothetical protein